MPGQNNGNGGGIVHPLLQFILHRYERYRAEEGSQASVKMRCPFLLLCSGDYSGETTPCDGTGYVSFQKLNEHIRDHHNPNLNQGQRTAPLPTQEGYKAWYTWTKSTRRTGVALKIEERGLKWRETAEKLGLITKSETLPKNVHLASVVDQMPYIYGFDRWLCGDQEADAAMRELSVHRYLEGHEDGVNSCVGYDSAYGSIGLPEPCQDGFDRQLQHSGETPAETGELVAQALGGTDSLMGTQYPASLEFGTQDGTGHSTE